MPVKATGAVLPGKERADKQPPRMAQVGDGVFHPDGTSLEVVDTSDTALLTVRFPTGAVAKIGRGAVRCERGVTALPPKGVTVLPPPGDE